MTPKPVQLSPHACGASCPDFDALSAFAERALAPELASMMEVHLAGCPVCATIVEDLLELPDTPDLGLTHLFGEAQVALLFELNPEHANTTSWEELRTLLSTLFSGHLSIDRDGLRALATVPVGNGASGETSPVNRALYSRVIQTLAEYLTTWSGARLHACVGPGRASVKPFGPVVDRVISAASMSFDQRGAGFWLDAQSSACLNGRLGVEPHPSGWTRVVPPEPLVLAPRPVSPPPQRPTVNARRWFPWRPRGEAPRAAVRSGAPDLSAEQVVATGRAWAFGVLALLVSLLLGALLFVFSRPDAPPELRLRVDQSATGEVFVQLEGDQDATLLLFSEEAGQVQARFERTPGARSGPMPTLSGDLAVAVAIRGRSADAEALAEAMTAALAPACANQTCPSALHALPVLERAARALYPDAEVTIVIAEIPEGRN